ncbi:hypothetical protein LPJ56_002325, partial [Coemansia sp. RSA 2599]
SPLLSTNASGGAGMRGSKRKDSQMDVEVVKKSRKGAGGGSAVDAESRDEGDGAFPRLRVVDLPLSIRARAFLNDDRGIPRDRGGRDAGCSALVLYRPPAVDVKSDDGARDQQEQPKSSGAVASSSMDIDVDADADAVVDVD